MAWGSLSLPVLCWFAFQCAALFRATVLALRERPITASFAPLGVYIYAVGGESCRNRLTLEGSARQGPKQSRAWHLWSSSARCSRSRPLSRSMRLRSRRLRGDTRRNASSVEYRLLALRRVSPCIRRTASLHVAQFGTRPLVPCLTFRCGAFFFVASALVDVPSASLTLPAANLPP